MLVGCWLPLPLTSTWVCLWPALRPCSTRPSSAFSPGEVSLTGTSQGESGHPAPARLHVIPGSPLRHLPACASTSALASCLFQRQGPSPSPAQGAVNGACRFFCSYLFEFRSEFPCGHVFAPLASPEHLCCLVLSLHRASQGLVPLRHNVFVHLVSEGTMTTSGAWQSSPETPPTCNTCATRTRRISSLMPRSRCAWPSRPRGSMQLPTAAGALSWLITVSPRMDGSGVWGLHPCAYVCEAASLCCVHGSIRGVHVLLATPGWS